MKFSSNQSFIAAVSVFALLGGTVLTAAELPPLPDPTPLFAPQTVVKGVPELEVGQTTIREKPYLKPMFKCGVKELRILDKNRTQVAEKFNPQISLYVNGKAAMNIGWFGGEKGMKAGWPFEDDPDDPGTVTVDEKNASFTIVKNYRSQGGQKQFHLTVCRRADNKIEITWNRRTTPHFYFFNYRSHGITVGGKPVPLTDPDALLKTKKTVYKVSGSMEYFAGNKLENFTVTVPGLSTIEESRTVVKKWGLDRCNLISAFIPTENKIVIDMGYGVLSNKAAVLPKGMYSEKMWEGDGTHIPTSPVRNLMPNPGFEQGLRHWRLSAHGWHFYIPGEQDLVYDVEYDDVVGGRSAMHIGSSRGQRPRGIWSFPIDLKPGKTYTISFYAKALGENRQMTLAIRNTGFTGSYIRRVDGDASKTDAKFTLTNEWKRYYRTFKSDPAGFQFIISGRDLLIDNMQLEEGNKPTEFVSAPLESSFTTNGEWNQSYSWTDLSPRLDVFGKPGTKGKVTLTVENIYRELVYRKTFDVTIGPDGRFAKDLNMKNIGTGLFTVRTEFEVTGFPKWAQYDRFSRITPLENRHATRKLCGSGISPNADRSSAIARRYKAWGLGSTTTVGMTDNSKEPPRQPTAFENWWMDQLRKNGIQGCHNAFEHFCRRIMNDLRHAKEVTPEQEKWIEEMSFYIIKNFPNDMITSFAAMGEEESFWMPANGKFDEFAKAQTAAYRGAKRANPKILVSPTQGTSGWSPIRGYDPFEQYLAAAKRKGVIYDILAVHPYGSYYRDFDAGCQHLVDLCKKYGYPDTTQFIFSENGDMSDTCVPGWGAMGNLTTYSAGKLGYDIGFQEINKASRYVTEVHSALKYHPRLIAINFWDSMPFLDLRLIPTAFVLGFNTFGNLLPDARFYCDLLPTPEIMGYVYKRCDGKGVATLVTEEPDVLHLKKEAPKMLATFRQPIKFYDFCGNERSAVVRNGKTVIPVTPLPLYMVADDVKILAEDLKAAKAESTDSPLEISVSQTTDGAYVANLKNMTGSDVAGELEIKGKKLPVKVPGQSKTVIPLEKGSSECGKYYDWNETLKLTTDGKSFPVNWKYRSFFIPHTDGMPKDWSKIPALGIENPDLPVTEKAKNLYSKDMKAKFRAAWDSKNLYLRIEIKDDNFTDMTDLWKKNPGGMAKQLYSLDGCVELYLDCAADGRLQKKPGFNENDYRYDFAPPRNGKPGRGEVYRLHEVYFQLADGMNMPKKEEAAKKIINNFEMIPGGYAYTITIAQRYLEPIVLRPGFSFGIALYVHDYDRKDGKMFYGSINNGTEHGKHVMSHAERWPVAILKP